MKNLLWVTNSIVELSLFQLRVTNSKLKNKKLHFELLTRSWKIKSYTSSYYLDGCTFNFSLSSCEREADEWLKFLKYCGSINARKHLEIDTTP